MRNLNCFFFFSFASSASLSHVWFVTTTLPPYLGNSRVLNDYLGGVYCDDCSKWILNYEEAGLKEARGCSECYNFIKSVIPFLFTGFSLSFSFRLIRSCLHHNVHNVFWSLKSNDLRYIRRRRRKKTQRSASIQRSTLWKLARLRIEQVSLCCS